jgi:hypothetical protein
VCLSLVSTGATARARYLVRRIRRRARRAHLVIGFWGRDQAEFSVEEATIATAADTVVTTLTAAVAGIEAALHRGPPSRSIAEIVADKLARQSA